MNNIGEGEVTGRDRTDSGVGGVGGLRKKQIEIQ